MLIHLDPTNPHRTKAHLARTMRSTAANTRNTRNSATGTPRLGRSLVAGLLAHGVRLALVLREALYEFS
jgi:hypothetical protein